MPSKHPTRSRKYTSQGYYCWGTYSWLFNRFVVVPDTLDWVSNTERTRWFLVLRLKKPKDDNLNRLLRISNQILGSYGQPSLYAAEKGSENGGSKHDKSKSRLTEAEDFTNCFHISLAWSLTEPSLEEQERVSSIALDEMKFLEISFSSVKAKIGNVVHSLNLESLWFDNKYE